MTTIEEAAPAKATRQDWIGLAVLALAALMYVMDLTVLHLAVPKMSAELQPSSAELLWIIDIYGFFVAGALITMGTLGDRIGRRRLLLVGAAAFGDHVLLRRLLDDAGDAHRQPGRPRHRRRDARAVDAGADLPHVPGPARADDRRSACGSGPSRRAAPSGRSSAGSRSSSSGGARSSCSPSRSWSRC